MPRNLPAPLAPDLPLPPAVPAWLRRLRGQDTAAVHMASGAALAVLHGSASDLHPIQTLWRQRLALGATLALIRLDGRREDEAALRDQWYLRAPGDDPGPAGRMLGAFRALGTARPGPAGTGRIPALFDLPQDQALAKAVEEGLARAAGLDHPVLAAAMAALPCLALGPRGRGPGLWLADSLLASRLGWPQALPLLAAHLGRADLRLGQTGEAEAFTLACARAWTEGALQALSLQENLLRAARRLLEAAPRLRARDKGEVVLRLLSEDAQAAQSGARASDRAGRRIFERLTAMQAVRELTGRASFRLYGL